MKSKSGKWLVLLLLCLVGCSAFDDSLLDESLDGGVIDMTIDAAEASIESSISQEDATMDRSTGFGDGYTPLDDAGGGDVSPDSNVDASLWDVTTPDLDASIDAETEDAETEIDSSSDAEAESDSEVDARRDTGLPSCQGTRLFGLCWYLTDNDQSCEELCADHQGFNPSTTDYTGSTEQGGNAENCSDVLDALGYSSDVFTANRADGMGFGCHLWDGTAWWLTSPDLAADVSYPPVRIACACLE